LGGFFFPPPPPRTREEIDVQRLYDKRFEKNRAQKDAIWKTLCRHYFQKFVPRDSAVMDIAAGNCEFINNIEAREKIAFDLNPDVTKYAAADVKAINASFFDMARHTTVLCDIIFASNVLEHLSDKEAVIDAMRLCHERLSPGGKLIILQPNIRYVKGAYWDFIDHKVPLTEKSLMEAGALCGFKTAFCVKRFLPYTTQSAIPQHPLLVLFYLKLPIVWLVLGKQSFLVLEKGHD
jgi:SAM-dependent methyltransferase